MVLRGGYAPGGLRPDIHCVSVRSIPAFPAPASRVALLKSASQCEWHSLTTLLKEIAMSKETRQSQLDNDGSIEQLIRSSPMLSIRICGCSSHANCVKLCAAMSSHSFMKESGTCE